VDKELLPGRIQEKAVVFGRAKAELGLVDDQKTTSRAAAAATSFSAPT
jgi:hypothetical protein